MTDVLPLSLMSDEILIRIALPFQEEVREFILELAARPGEDQTLLFLDSWCGELVIPVMRQASWYRQYLVNEPNQDRFRLLSQEINAHWGEDKYLHFQNLPTEECLAGLPHGRIMLTIAAQSLWAMSNTLLQNCLKKLNRSLHRNGCVVLSAPVQPREPEISKHLFAHFDRSLPRGSLLRSCLAERLNQVLNRTEEDFHLMFIEAELDYECVCKSYPFQCWLLTHTPQIRKSEALFSV